MITPARRRGSRFPLQAGFSLIELLIGSVIGGLILASVSSLIVSQIRASATQVQIQRLRSDWRKLQDLIRTEAAESQLIGGASLLESGLEIQGCANTEGTLLFVLEVPLYSPSPAYPDDLTDYGIVYYTVQNDDGQAEVRRCGPAINEDGTLSINRWIGVDPVFLMDAPGALVLQGIPLTAGVSPDGRTLTITPTNPIPNAVTPFTVRAKVQGSL